MAVSGNKWVNFSNVAITSNKTRREMIAIINSKEGEC